MQYYRKNRKLLTVLALRQHRCCFPMKKIGGAAWDGNYKMWEDKVNVSIKIRTQMRQLAIRPIN